MPELLEELGKGLPCIDIKQLNCKQLELLELLEEQARTARRASQNCLKSMPDLLKTRPGSPKSQTAEYLDLIEEQARIARRASKNY